MSSNFQTLSVNLKILKYLGLWKSDSWVTGVKGHLYNIYTVVAVLFVFSMVFSESIALVTSFHTLKEAADSLFVNLTMLSGFLKTITILYRRKAIIRVFKSLNSELCQPQNIMEKNILKKFHRLIRFRTRLFTSVVGMTIFGLMITDLMRAFSTKRPRYNVWVPFDISRPFVTQFIIIHQIISHIYQSIVHIVHDSLVPGIILMIRGQLALLGSRIQQVSETKDCTASQKLQMTIFTRFVQHHLAIFQVASEVNSIFGATISFQFFISLIVLCMSTYKLAMEHFFSLEFWSLAIYTLAIFLQIYLVCLAGSELSVDSLELSNVIFGTDWTSMSSQSKQSVLLMMIRCLKPIKFTCVGTFHATNVTFLSIIKFSYSMYSVLQTLS